MIVVVFDACAGLATSAAVYAAAPIPRPPSTPNASTAADSPTFLAALFVLVLMRCSSRGCSLWRTALTFRFRAPSWKFLGARPAAIGLSQSAPRRDLLSRKTFSISDH